MKRIALILALMVSAPTAMLAQGNLFSPFAKCHSIQDEDEKQRCSDEVHAQNLLGRHDQRRGGFINEHDPHFVLHDHVSHVHRHDRSAFLEICGPEEGPKGFCYGYFVGLMQGILIAEDESGELVSKAPGTEAYKIMTGCKGVNLDVRELAAMTYGSILASPQDRDLPLALAVKDVLSRTYPCD